MDKYQVLAIMNVLETILVLGIIVCAALYSWWLLLLLLGLNGAEAEKRILGCPDE